MSNYHRSRHVHDANTPADSMLAKVRSELSSGFVEIEVEGLSFRRLACIYIAGARETRERVLAGMRSLFGLKHAH